VSKDGEGARETCRHADCGCPRSGSDSVYCGTYCANAEAGESLPGEADLAESTCACGHAACNATKPEPVGREPVISTGRT
jgi:hypothetical protein